MAPQSAPTGSRTELRAGSEQAGPEPQATSPALVEEELLVEEISIDGMCGVY